MEAQPYDQMSEMSLMALCCYREARGEPQDGKRGVCHVIQNRAEKPGWWGTDIKSVILKPYQFSSFLANDPNSIIWPMDNNPAWTQCLSAASSVMFGSDPDPTDGALYYHDSSITFPKAWGKEEDYVKTLVVGKLSFYRPL
jgi:spore germination cell wall hydrolase CwlJ-like protein